MTNIKEKLVLASGSPRRLELLEKMGISPEVIVSSAEEIDGDFEPDKLVVANAMIKALVVLRQHPTRSVLGSDTVVAIDGKILGKPKDAAHAKEMLEMLSGRMHSVFTGVALLEDTKMITEVVESKVKFRDLCEAEILDYIATGEPFDKAGAYGIQGLGKTLILEYTGEFDNIVGLPIETVAKMLDVNRYNG